MNTSIDLGSTGLEVLGRDECLALMKTVPVGRIVFTEGALPAIQPVNFALDGDSVVIRIGIGSKLALAAKSAVVAFECDEFDEQGMTGWSVVLIGRAEAVGGENEKRRLADLRITPWALGSRAHYLRIVPEIVRGRRILTHVPAV
ncbi:pyridoxamine 5'-phosphate oxidase family protein [Phytoactinopolyspora mesophila]|uniref:Pyridoxamine 5'-phosphate oxidase family protein n=1 Tax=Phytoactinopolyspora mesophila TaxID=2650750 RepID=A0A7K3MB68_9ACTN|nr:pyridoxamine 5'-phosphate oxidase family protein [Phytoactinopolyspora mesophila]NDL59648.1 pyridoxamine 5'-phosphate oxidase family protein [Phytoactinopolyspora mesophila]